MRRVFHIWLHFLAALIKAAKKKKVFLA